MTRVNRSAARFGMKNGTNGNGVYTALAAKELAFQWVQSNLGFGLISFGLPEVDDRYGAWRIALLEPSTSRALGELMVACHDGAILQATDPALVLKRLDGKPVDPNDQAGDAKAAPRAPKTKLSGNDIFFGDSRNILSTLEDRCIQLVVTSPPYFNAKPAYSEYIDYDEYLELLKQVFRECHRTLAEGRFMVVNASPVLVRRPSRNKSSVRIPVPFHINTLMEGLGFDFLDDIIWAKPAGAGWNTGRGRRFAADRHPLQYKPVPVTEYFLVYRKHTEKLIDWNIRNHPDQDAVQQSRVEDGYEITNVWYEKPASHPVHPAVFPAEIIRKLIRYYSFAREIVLDPFAGVGTVGHAARAEGRRFCLIDSNQEYYAITRRTLVG